MHLRQAGVNHVLKTKKKNTKIQRNRQYILIAYFQHDMNCEDFKDLPWKTASD